MIRITFLIIVFFSIRIQVFGQSKPNSNEKLKQSLIIKIEKGLKKITASSKMQLYASDIDSVEADVDKLNKIDLETSLKYYPRLNLLREKAENGQAQRKKLLSKSYRESGQKEFYTLMSIIEEDEKLNSFDPKDLIEICDRAFELMTNPENDLVYNEKIYFIRGKAYFELHNFYSAILNFKKISTLIVDTVSIKYIALSYFNVNKMPEAVNFIDKALTLNPNDEDLTYARYLINKKNKHEAGMFADLLELLDANPNNIKYIKLMGDYYFDQKKYMAAWKEYEKIATKDAQNSFAWMLMGNCYLAMNDKPNAIVHFKKAQLLNNRYAGAIIESLEQDYVFINSQNVALLNKTGIGSKPLLYLNTGFKIKILDENDKWNTVLINGIDSTEAIIGFIPKDKTMISLLGLDEEPLNQNIPYSYPNNSPLYNKPSTTVFYKNWQSNCFEFINSKGVKKKLNLDCPEVTK
jgi:tetratricopeptide (TPR) repeat protein